MIENSNIALFNLKKNIESRLPKTKKEAGFTITNSKRNLETQLDSIIDFQNDVFLHVGLRQLAETFAGTYNEIALNLINGIPERTSRSLFVPAYTPSFREAGFFSQQHTLPAFGYFNRLALKYANFRTIDPVHSLSVVGTVPQWCRGTPTYFETFTETGHFSRLATDNCTLINIGTDELISTFLHLIETRIYSPYKCFDTDIFAGKVLLNNGKIQNITVKNHAYVRPTSFNRKKIERFLVKEDALKVTTIGNLKVFQCQTANLVEALTRKLIVDPTFMVTF